jgi:hypothetical protein
MRTSPPKWHGRPRGSSLSRIPRSPQCDSRGYLPRSFRWGGAGCPPPRPPGQVADLACAVVGLYKERGQESGSYGRGEDGKDPPRADRGVSDAWSLGAAA